MALPDIVATIRREAEEEALRRGARASKIAAETLAQARAQAAEWQAGMEDAVAKEAAAARTRELNRARLRLRRAEQEARETIYQAARAQVRAALDGSRTGADYPRLFKALLLEAQRALPNAADVRIDPRDAGLVDGLSVETTLHTWGGAELVAADGRVVRNTLEERLRRAEPELRRLAAHALAET
ncbi:MAG: V-type ATP synthase subunit E family protein [Planctomycetota bacterium]|jgi:vacuolar-type H+-ATPase subunit E/Vma4